MFDNKWKQIRSQTPEWWGLMHEDDLKKGDKSAYKLDKYATMLQVKYGYTRRQAHEEITSRVADFEAIQPAANGKIKEI
jgi:hypothetical protein